MPRQASLAPAADLLAMAVGILVAFKAFEDVVAVLVAVFGRGLGRIARAHAGAAQEQQYLIFARYHVQLFDELIIGHPAWIGAPLDRTMLGLGDGDAADPVALGIGAHV